MEILVVVSILSSILSLVFIIFCINWMSKMLKYTKKNCVSTLIMNKIISKYLKNKGEDIDLYLIQETVERELKIKY